MPKKTRSKNRPSDVAPDDVRSDDPLKDDEVGLKILYTEDEPDILEPLLDYVQRTYGRESVGARSVEGALKLLNDPRPPDFAIHDCKILYSDDSRMDSINAGNELYVELVDRGIPVVVLSGSDEGREDEPYVSSPPVLGFLSKPAHTQKIDEAVERFRQYCKKEKE